MNEYAAWLALNGWQLAWVDGFHAGYAAVKIRTGHPIKSVHRIKTTGLMGCRPVTPIQVHVVDWARVKDQFVKDAALFIQRYKL